MKLLALALGVATTAAYPGYKTCTSQFGSDANGLPVQGTNFTAMGVTWAQDTDASIVTVGSDGGITLNLGADIYGFFAMVDSGNISFTNYTNMCAGTCDQLICAALQGEVSIAIDASEDDCSDVQLVVGYADASTTGNTLQFVNVDVCSDDDDAPLSDAATTGVSAAILALTLGAYVVA